MKPMSAAMALKVKSAEVGEEIMISQHAKLQPQQPFVGFSARGAFPAMHFMEQAVAAIFFLWLLAGMPVFSVPVIWGR